MGLSEVTRPALEYICLNMRQCDVDEIMNIVPHDSRVRLAQEAHWLITNHGRGRVAWHEARPAAVIFLTEDRPGVWEIGMFGTDQFKAVAFECMRWARKEIPTLIGEPLHGKRLQCDSRVGHEDAHKFLRALGAQPEGPPMRCYGKDGGSYQRYVWIAGEDDHVLRRQEQQHRNTETRTAHVV